MFPNLNRNVGILTPQALSEICIGIRPAPFGQNPFRGQRETSITVATWFPYLEKYKNTEIQNTQLQKYKNTKKTFFHKFALATGQPISFKTHWEVKELLQLPSFLVYKNTKKIKKWKYTITNIQNMYKQQ